MHDYREPICEHPSEELRYAVKQTTLGLGKFAFFYVFSSILIGSFLVPIFFPQWEEQQWYLWFIAVVPLYGIGLPIYLRHIRRVPKVKLEKRKLSPGDLFLLFPMCVALSVMGNMVATFLVSFLSRFFPHINQSNPVGEAVTSRELMMTVILAVVIAPIMEELICRKLLLDRVHPMGEGISIVLSGIMFGVLHCNLHQFVYATLIGMLWAFIYLKTGRVIYTMILHMCLNLFCGVVPTIVMGDLATLDLTQEIVLTVELLKSLWRMITYVTLEYAFVLVGMALFFVFFKKMVGSISPSPIKKRYQFQMAFLTRGTFLLLAVGFGLICLNLFV